jgi:hypothetical protein
MFSSPQGRVNPKPCSVSSTSAAWRFGCGPPFRLSKSLSATCRALPRVSRDPVPASQFLQLGCCLRLLQDPDGLLLAESRTKLGSRSLLLHKCTCSDGPLMCTLIAYPSSPVYSVELIVNWRLSPATTFFGNAIWSLLLWASRATKRWRNSAAWGRW